MFSEWADTPKRKDRYKDLVAEYKIGFVYFIYAIRQFRGEKIHIMVGEVDKFRLCRVKPTSDEGNAWSGKKLMSLLNPIKVMNENMYVRNTICF